MASNKRWTDEEVQYIKDNYHSKTCNELAEILNVAPKRVRNKIAYMVENDELVGKAVKYNRPENYVRKPRPNIPTSWDIGYGGCTIAHISMCIEEDFNQTLEELAARVAESKECPYEEALKVLCELKEQGRLIYYDKELIPKIWKVEELK